MVFKFYSDLDEPNKMDEKPFFEFDLRDFKDQAVAELKRFTKSAFDIEDMLSAAVELKYTKEIKKVFGEQLSEPDPEIVRFFASRVYGGKLTKTVREQFSAITRRALQQFIHERISDRLKFALSDEDASVSAETPEADDAEAVAEKKSGVVTTDEEVEGYHIVKAILRETVAVARVTMRDTKSYCGILLDDNNRKPICRLHFNSATTKYLGLFDANKREERVPLADLNDIYAHAERLKETVSFYT